MAEGETASQHQGERITMIPENKDDQTESKNVCIEMPRIAKQSSDQAPKSLSEEVLSNPLLTVGPVTLADKSDGLSSLSSSASLSSKDNPTTENKSLPSADDTPVRTIKTKSAASFFFRAKPTQLIKDVKRILIDDTEDKDEEFNLPKRSKEFVPETPQIKPKSEDETIEKPVQIEDRNSDDDIAIIKVTKPHSQTQIPSQSKETLIDLCSDQSPPSVRASLAQAQTMQATITRIASRKVGLSTSEMSIARIVESPVSLPPPLRPPSSPPSIEDNIDPLLREAVQKLPVTPSLAETTPPFTTPYVVVINETAGMNAVTAITSASSRGGRQFRLVMFANEPIWKKYRDICSKHKINPHGKVLIFKKVRVFSTATPESLGMSIKDTNELYAMTEIDYSRMELERRNERIERLRALQSGLVENQESLEELTQLAEEVLRESDTTTANYGQGANFMSTGLENEIRLSIKYKMGVNPETFNIDSNMPLSSIVEAVRTRFSLANNENFVLIFDGSKLNLSESPATLGLEDEDLLELRL